MENNTINITKIFQASIEKVWDAFTNTKSLMQWKSPENMTTENVQVDLKVGGAYSVTMVGGPMGKVTIRGTYEAIENPTLLVFSWQWDGGDEKSKVTIHLKKLSDTETEMNFIHEGFITKESMESHHKGWDSTFRKLENFLK